MRQRVFAKTLRRIWDEVHHIQTGRNVTDWPDALSWCREVTCARWSHSERFEVMYFEAAEDALNFIMAWGGKQTPTKSGKFK